MFMYCEMVHVVSEEQGMDKLIFKIYSVDSVLSESMTAMKQYFRTDTLKTIMVNNKKQIDQCFLDCMNMNTY